MQGALGAGIGIRNLGISRSMQGALGAGIGIFRSPPSPSTPSFAHRPPEDRRPIEGLTSKPRPNSEVRTCPCFLFFPSATGHQRRGLSFCPQPSLAHRAPRDPWHTARLNLPAACDFRPADDMLLATEGAYQRILGSRGAPAACRVVEARHLRAATGRGIPRIRIPLPRSVREDSTG